MKRADRGLSQAMQRLSTGLRINSARDDAAGLAIANKLNFQVGGLNQASENATHGISLVQTAEGALTEVHAMLQRMRELAVQASNDTNTPRDREIIQREIDQLTEEVHLISQRTEFNRMRILAGEADRIVRSFSEHITGIPPSPNIAAFTRNIVTTLYISEQVQAGHLNYTITHIGKPAVAEVTLAEGPIVINGTTFIIGAGGGSNPELIAGLEAKGIQLLADGTGGANDYFLVTTMAGRSQSITVNGVTSQGQDAEIEIDGIYDSLGNPIRNTALSSSAIGNQVLIRGSRGEDIRLNIQVNFDPITGIFVLGDGTTLAGSPRLPSEEPVRLDEELTMSKEFRDFGPLMLQIGPNHNNAMHVQIPRLNAETLGLVEFVAGERRSLISYRSREGAEAALAVVDRAIATTATVRSRLGAYQNRLESTVRSLDITAENTEQSRSRIQDANIAVESTRLATHNVMFQAAQAILSQANQRPQQLISLLQ